MDQQTTTECFNFTLDRVTFPVTIGKEKYLLVEADSETSETFQSMIMGSLTVTQGHDGAAKRIDKIDSGMIKSQSYLVSRCLKKLSPGVHPDDPLIEEPVSLATVRGWPNRIVKPLYEKAREISDLREDDDAKKAEAKNS